MRILITGSREWPRMDVVYRALGSTADLSDTVVVHGNAKGADTHARHWARIMPDCITDEPHYADWERFGKPAGYIRNQEMVDLGADVCLAFPHPDPLKRKGTGNCMRIADAAGIPVRVYDVNGFWLPYHRWRELGVS